MAVNGEILPLPLLLPQPQFYMMSSSANQRRGQQRSTWGGHVVELWLPYLHCDEATMSLTGGVALTGGVGLT